MFNDYETININGRNIDITKLSVDELKNYLDFFNKKERDVINKQNEYLSQLLG